MASINAVGISIFDADFGRILEIFGPYFGKFWVIFGLYIGRFFALIRINQFVDINNRAAIIKDIGMPQKRQIAKWTACPFGNI